MTKGDYMERIMELDSSIRVMDAAIPLHLARGLDCSYYAYAYYKDGTEGLLNIVEHLAALQTRCI